MKDSRGFTLLELLMVVIIIAILASIALPQYLRTAERSRASEALTLLASIRSSQQRFLAQNPGAWATPALQCQLDIDIPGAVACPGAPAASTMWTYTVDDGGGLAGANAFATRIITGDAVHIDLNSGATCVMPAASAPIYGLPGGPC
jgi:prepilin-type N-terminal cleavage/methylation domain-containing protein